MNYSPTPSAKNAAIVAYLTLIGTVIAIFMNNDERHPFASFHIRQALGIFLVYLILGYPVGMFDSWMISSSFWVFIFVLWLYGFLGALNNEKRTVPIIGDFFQNFFKNL